MTQRDVTETVPATYHLQEITKLDAEIERLRAVISKAADWVDPDFNPNGMTGREMASTLRLFLATGKWEIGTEVRSERFRGAKAMSEHTPGPWIVFVDGNTDSMIFSVLPAGRTGTIADNIENGPDADLIAAAPTMRDYIAKRAATGDVEAKHILEVINGNT